MNTRILISMKQLVIISSLILTSFTATNSFGLGPHECVILANRRTTESVELANFYAHLRQIPPINIIHLDLPDKALDADATFTPEEFRQYIYNPVQKVLRERGIASHVLVWLYSLDFPARIDTTPTLSLTGMTFVRGNPPPPESVENGSWLSPLYLGPDKADGPKSPPAGLEEFTIQLTTNMPLPSMLLGWSGSRGMTLAQIKDQLRTAASSDGAHPSATVYFEVSQDVRSEIRKWQFEPVIKELSAQGVAGIASSNMPVSRTDLMGVMGGRSTFSSEAYGMLRPGGYADHLTSFAGLFNEPGQTKLTEWLKRGAAGSSGTVVEPGSLTKPVTLWPKFPTARMFNHYASGCSLVESLYFATRCPLQLLMVGDALCSPWTKPPGITLISMADDETAPIMGKGEFLASSWGAFGQRAPTIIYFLDGRPVNQPGSKSDFTIDTSRIFDGCHELRVVAYASDSIRHQGFDKKYFTSRNRNRSCVLGGYEPNQEVDNSRDLTFHITAEGSPREAAIIVQERVIARAAFSNNTTLSFSPAAVGGGPVTFQGVVVYDDNEPVRSEPITLNLTPLNQPPQISSMQVHTNDRGELVCRITATDPEQDPVALFWFADILKGSGKRTLSPAGNDALNVTSNDVLTLAARSNVVFSTHEIDQPNSINEIGVTLRLYDRLPVSADHTAGLVFNYLDENNYLYWGLHGGMSAWALIRVSNGEEHIVLSRGIGIDPGNSYSLSVAALSRQMMGLFVDGELLAFADASFTAGRIGVKSGKAKVVYNQLLVSPASSYRSYFAEQQNEVVIGKDHLDESRVLLGAARDSNRKTSLKRPD